MVDPKTADRCLTFKIKITQTSLTLVYTGVIATAITLAVLSHTYNTHIGVIILPGHQNAVTPVRRHVWRWTSERERDKSVFGVASMSGLSGFRNNETRRTCECAVTPPPTHVNLVTIGSLATHQILAQLATRIPRYRDGGARAHVQRCPTRPMTCGKHVLSDAQPTYQIWTPSVKPFRRYRSTVCTCAREEIPHPWLVLST